MKKLANDTGDMKKLRILMLAPQPWFQPRGTPFSVLHRIKAFSLLGHHIDLATYHIGQDIPLEHLSIYRSRNLPFIKKVKVGPSKTKLFLDFFLIALTLKLLKNNKYDLIHTHEEASFWGAFLARVLKIPHLYDMHSSLPQQLINFKFTKLKPLLKLFDELEKFTIKNASAVITICPELQYYVEQHFPDKKSMLIENVADNSIIFKPDPGVENHLRKTYGLEGKKIILYYGTFEPYQGLDLLIDSATFVLNGKSGDIVFLLVGGNEKQQLQYKDKVRGLNLEKNFVFTGFAQPEVIPAYVNMADVLVSPRLKGNNSPLKIYSYLRSGKPIVATRHITHTQILDETVAVLTKPEPRDFAFGINSVLEDKNRSNELVKAAQKLAADKYSYDEYLHKTRKVLEMIAGNID
ncbi:glycosyltransferase family 4 protein [candidate division KSB1 bacterium]|nr:glycosyltransferase family 4 protein [candidate division KSB1 bacterium]